MCRLPLQQPEPAHVRVHWTSFLCSSKGEHIVVALSVRPSVLLQYPYFIFRMFFLCHHENIMANLNIFGCPKLKKRALMHTGFLSLSPHHPPDITEILLKRTQNPKSAIHLSKNQIKLMALNHFFSMSELHY